MYYQLTGCKDNGLNLLAKFFENFLIPYCDWVLVYMLIVYIAPAGIWSFIII